jgi:RimJ/RimL family protein N-acetyltransferase
MGPAAATNGGRATVLETERLTLRHFSTADAEFMLDLLNQPSFIANIGDRGVRTVEEAAVYLTNGALASYERHGFGLYLVVLRETGVGIGTCGLLKREALEDVDLGFAFLPEHWSRGYAAEAARAVRDYAARQLGLRRLVAIVLPTNQSSLRVLAKTGFTYERTIRLPGEDVDLSLLAWDANPALNSA